MISHLIDLTTDVAIRHLATPATIRNGHTIMVDGEVAFGAFSPDYLEAQVMAPHMNTRRTTFSVEDGQLIWSCSCATTKRFCKHLVATALATQKEGRGDIYKAAGILIQGRKLLHERSQGKPAFIAPGGRIEPGETAPQALIRELKEELTISVEESDLKPFGTFSAEAANHPGQRVHMQVFLVTNWQGDIQPGAEVEELLWLNSAYDSHLTVGSISTHEIMPRLRKADLID